MEEGHLIDAEPTGHDRLLDIVRPGFWGRGSQIVIESDPGFLHLGTMPQAWGRPSHNAGTARLPILQKGPVRYVWRHEVSDRTNPAELQAEPFVVARR